MTTRPGRPVFTVRTDPAEKDAFLAAARSEGKDGSDLIRQFMRRYVARHTPKDSK